MFNIQQDERDSNQMNQMNQMNQGRLTPASLIRNEDMENLNNLSKMLMQYDDMLSLLRREFRGEVLYTDENGKGTWVQLTKPLFIKLDDKGKPLRKFNPILMDESKRKLDYVPNDEAIDEVIMELKFFGINKITPITGLEENEIRTDLRAIACKLAAVLCLKQKEWGIDKELMPMRAEQIMTIIKDARYIPLNGNLLKALRSTIQRVEQTMEQLKPGTRTPFN